MTESQELLSEAGCYLCHGVSLPQALILAIEARWLLAVDPTADTSASHLMSYGSVYAGYGTPFDIMEISLLDKISIAS